MDLGHADEAALLLDQDPIVDAHHHLWDLDRPGYQWLREPGDQATANWIGDYRPIRRSYLIDEYIHDAAGCHIAKSVHVEASRGTADAVDETRWLQAIADRVGFPHAIVASVDLSAPDAEARLDHHLESPNTRGIRNVRMGEFTERSFVKGFAALAERGLAFDANLRIEQSAGLLDLATSFPATVIAINNMTNPPTLDAAALGGWRMAMQPLASTPNIVMKISGMGMADHQWAIERLRPWVLSALEIFCPDRCMFGSNWPVDRLYASLADSIRALRSIVDEHGADAAEHVFRRTAERCYRI